MNEVKERAKEPGKKPGNEPGNGPGKEDTGRLTGTLAPRTRRIVYGDQSPAEIRRELEPITTIDLAHVVMLTGSGLLPGEAAARLIEAVRRLRASGFRELAGLAAPRGAYLMYEGHLSALAAVRDAILLLSLIHI